MRVIQSYRMETRATWKPSSLVDLPDPDRFDVVVLGAGGAGMSAAVFAAIGGARVLLVESTGHVGGTTAWSAGTTWVPGTLTGAGVNPDDSIDAAGRFLDRAVGDRAARELRQAFLAHGAEAVATMQDRTHLKYRARPLHPDYLSELEGSTLCGRAIEPLPFDGRLLGDLFPLVRPPIPEFTVLHGMMVDRDDIGHLLGVRKSFASVAHVTRLLARHVADRLRHPRGTRLLMGNALIGRLLLSLRDLGVTLLMQTEATRLERGRDGSIDAVDLRQRGVERRIGVDGGVILATGGFNRDPARRAALLPGIDLAWCAGAPGLEAGAHRLAEAVGAAYGEGGLSPCYWAPVSLRKRADGSTAVFPHFVFDRAKPGTVVVGGDGSRFVNESTSYHLFGLAMQQAAQVPAYLITDDAGMRRYGLGIVRPGAMGLASALADGYVTRADSVVDLAQRLSLPPDALERSIGRIGEFARTGVDTEFGRGTTAYQRANGDPTWPGPNPTLGPIDRPPFYALRLYPGDIGAATGFRTDADARVLDASGAPIVGLYAVGNDMHSVMGGVYPAPGITIGPGLVFAWLAARDARSRPAGRAARITPARAGVITADAATVPGA